jgi:hypothetical protein
MGATARPSMVHRRFALQRVAGGARVRPSRGSRRLEDAEPPVVFVRSHVETHGYQPGVEERRVETETRCCAASRSRQCSFFTAIAPCIVRREARPVHSRSPLRRRFALGSSQQKRRSLLTAALIRASRRTYRVLAMRPVVQADNPDPERDRPTCSGRSSRRPQPTPRLRGCAGRWIATDDEPCAPAKSRGR